MNQPAPGTPPNNSTGPETTSKPIRLSVGNIDSFRYRGVRQSAPLLSIIETIISDVSLIYRRLVLCFPFTKRQILISQTGYPVQSGLPSDPRRDQYVENINNLYPNYSQLNMIKIASIRAQLAYYLSNNI